jgi:hypothetical protein
VLEKILIITQRHARSPSHRPLPIRNTGNNPLDRTRKRSLERIVRKITTATTTLSDVVSAVIAALAKVLTIAAFAIAACLTLALSGCAVIAGPPSPPRFVVIVDTTTTSVAPPMVLRVLEQQSLAAIDARTSIELRMVDAHKGSRHVVEWIPTPPTSEAKKYLSAYREQQREAAAQVFSVAVQALFAEPPPKNSPLAAAILTSVTSGPTDETLIGDGREVSNIANFERNPPDNEIWKTKLTELGYAKDSLKDVAIHFVAFELVAKTDPDGSTARGNRVKELWQQLESFGAKTITFENERNSAFVWLFLVPGPLLLWWRKRKAFKRGYEDATGGHGSDPHGAVIEVYRRKPYAEPDDPEEAQANQTVAKMELVIAVSEKRIGELDTKVARQPNVWIRIAGITGLLGADGLATATMLHEFGTPAPHDTIFGIGTAATMIGLAGLAAKGTKIDGKKPNWWWATVAGLGVFTLSMITARVSNAPVTGDPLFVVIAIAIVQGIGIFGCPLLTEMLFESIRPVMPDVMELRMEREKLRKAKKELALAVKFLAKRTKAREIWENWAATLMESYKRGYKAGGGKLPPSGGLPPIALAADPPPPASAGGNTQASEKGLPTWPTN